MSLHALTLARAGCGEKSFGSKRESHVVIANYCEDLQRVEPGAWTPKDAVS